MAYFWGSPTITNGTKSAVTLALQSIHFGLSERTPSKGPRFEKATQALKQIKTLQEEFADLIVARVCASDLSAPCCHVFTPQLIGHMVELFLETGNSNKIFF